MSAQGSGEITALLSRLVELGARVPELHVPPDVYDAIAAQLGGGPGPREMLVIQYAGGRTRLVRRELAFVGKVIL